MLLTMCEGVLKACWTPTTAQTYEPSLLRGIHSVALNCTHRSSLTMSAPWVGPTVAQEVEWVIHLLEPVV